MDQYCVFLDYTIKEVIEKFDNNKERVAVVLNEKKKVVGVISQGDIVRALCSGKSLYTRIENVIQPSFLYLEKRNLEEAYKVFKAKKITMLPIINSEYYLIGIVTLDDIYAYLEMK